MANLSPTKPLHHKGLNKQNQHKGHTMRKLLRKWLGIETNTEAIVALGKCTDIGKVAELEASVKELKGLIATIVGGLDKITDSASKMSDVLATNTKSIAGLKDELNGVKDILEYHTKEIVELKKK